MEIDEMLALRVMSPTDDEKNLMTATDEIARRNPPRSETMSEDAMSKLHGAVRSVDT